MIRRLVLALLIAASPTLGFAQVRGTTALDALNVSGAATAGSVVTPSLVLGGFTLTGVGTTSGTVAAGNDSRIIGAIQQSALSSAIDTTFSSIQGSVLYRGASAWLALAPGSAGNVLTTGGAGANPSWAAASGGVSSSALDTAFGSTQGSILYRSASAWTVLTPGTAGYLLQTGGSGANPSWTAPSSSGTYTPTPSAPSTNTTLATGDAERPLYPTGSPTITMANSGAGWRTGAIRSANTASGIVTLAVPSGATLDGTTNGTTPLYPYQSARIVQTGSTAYVTDWIERSPIIATVAISSVTAQADLVLPAGYTSFELKVSHFKPVTDGSYLSLRFSDDNGSTFKTGASDYSRNITKITSSLSNVAATAGAQIEITGPASSSSSNNDASVDVLIAPGGVGAQASALARSQYYDSGGINGLSLSGGAIATGATTNRITTARVFTPSGNLASVNLTLRAVP